ncbi:MAG: polyphosphate polymerase domain-containing protein [Saprospiraceae bacterium]|nr:polyphosphate polymerase domain-containing protein [Saprospiraceae bacterium]MBL0294734.1 polyphosphate polymerase domain-containing protein [Saprospiraceae bacterium]
MGLNLLNFAKISLDDAREKASNGRLDVKYLCHCDNLPSFLEILASDYRILTIDGEQIFDYESRYFDTPDFHLFYEHQIGKYNRKKIRIRRYLATNEVWVEVKKKIKGIKTEKIRHKTDLEEMAGSMPPNLPNSIEHELKDCSNLNPVLDVNYKRITLVNLELNQRITIDLELTFYHESKKLCLEDLAIIEFKFLPKNAPTLKDSTLKRTGLFKSKFSKYCVGLGLLASVKQNLLAPEFYLCEKLKNKHHV